MLKCVQTYAGIIRSVQGPTVWECSQLDVVKTVVVDSLFSFRISTGSELFSALVFLQENVQVSEWKFKDAT